MIALVAMLALAPAAGVTLRPVSTSNTISLTDPARQSCSLVVRNHTSKRVEIWLCGFWPNHHMAMFDATGAPVALTSLGRQGAQRFGSRDRDKNAPQVARAGGSYRYATPSLVSALELRKGDYTLSEIYDEKWFGKPLRLSCDKIRGKVVN